MQTAEYKITVGHYCMANSATLTGVTKYRVTFSVHGQPNLISYFLL